MKLYAYLALMCSGAAVTLNSYQQIAHQVKVVDELSHELREEQGAHTLTADTPVPDYAELQLTAPSNGFYKALGGEWIDSEKCNPNFLLSYVRHYINLEWAWDDFDVPDFVQFLSQKCKADRFFHEDLIGPDKRAMSKQFTKAGLRVVKRELGKVVKALKAACYGSISPALKAEALIDPNFEIVSRCSHDSGLSDHDIREFEPILSEILVAWNGVSKTYGEYYLSSKLGAKGVDQSKIDKYLGLFFYSDKNGDQLITKEEFDAALQQYAASKEMEVREPSGQELGTAFVKALQQTGGGAGKHEKGWVTFGLYKQLMIDLSETNNFFIPFTYWVQVEKNIKDLDTNKDGMLNWCEITGLAVEDVCEP